jgi:hypothetical protein
MSSCDRMNWPSVPKGGYSRSALLLSPPCNDRRTRGWRRIRCPADAATPCSCPERYGRARIVVGDTPGCDTPNPEGLGFSPWCRSAASSHLPRVRGTTHSLLPKEKSYNDTFQPIPSTCLARNPRTLPGCCTTWKGCTWKEQQRHRFYAPTFSVQPPTYGSVKVPSLGSTSERRCQIWAEAPKRIAARRYPTA